MSLRLGLGPESVGLVFGLALEPLSLESKPALSSSSFSLSLSLLFHLFLYIVSILVYASVYVMHRHSGCGISHVV